MADITVRYDRDILRGTLALLDVSPLRTLVRSGMRVAIKPNLVLAKPAASGATTHAEVVEGLIQYLADCGCRAEIIESAWVGDDTKRAYRVCGYDRLSKRYDVPLYDLKDDSAREVQVDGHSFAVCAKALDAEFLINVPVLKAHGQTRLTCCLKNLKGCIPDREKRRFHTLGLHGPIAWLNAAVRTRFCLVDGICGDLTFEEGGNPVTRHMLLAAEDPLLTDSYCAELLGYRADEIEYLGLAAGLGVGQLFGADSEVREWNTDQKPARTAADSGIVKRLSAYAAEDGACSACYAALICALHKTGVRPPQKIQIGQGFRQKPGALGCGSCASGCDRYVPGCPPKASEVAVFLEGI